VGIVATFPSNRLNPLNSGRIIDIRTDLGQILIAVADPVMRTSAG
jgi:hypothetical protein